MEAVVLCGGFGTRIEPIGLFFPKALLPIKGRPILDYIVSQIDGIKEVDRIIISTNKKFLDQFTYYITAKKALGLKKQIDLVVEPSMQNDEKFGSVKGLAYAIEKMKINSDILSISGDNFYDFDLEMLLKHFHENRKTTIALYDIKSLKEAKKYGVVKLDGKRMIEFEEKPKSPKSTIVSTGIYIYPKENLNLFNLYLQEKKISDAYGDFIKWHLKKKEVDGIRFNGGYGRWFDIGTLETYKKVYDMANETE